MNAHGLFHFIFLLCITSSHCCVCHNFLLRMSCRKLIRFMVRPKSWYIVVQLKRVVTRLSRPSDCSRNLQEIGFVYLIY